MELEWISPTVGQWRELLQKVPRANWMQSWPYAKAARVRDFKSIRVGLIKKNNESVGLMVLQEIKLGPIHLIELNRGPLWFTEIPSLQLMKEFTALFRKSFPRRWGRRLRWLPEWDNALEAQEILKQNDFQFTKQTYETIWLDLKKSLVELRSLLKQKWRNCLSKAERSELKVTVDSQGKNLHLFLKYYSEHKQQKNYQGASAEFVYQEVTTAAPLGDVILIWAWAYGEPVAAVMLLKHGKSASYRVGWNTQVGRMHNAHYLLLWKGIELLKNDGLEAFDLGGIKPEAPSLSHFKNGMGGVNTKLPGLFS